MTAFFFEVSYIVMVSDFHEENYMFWNQNVKVQTRVYPDMVHKNYLDVTIDRYVLIYLRAPKGLRGQSVGFHPEHVLCGNGV